MAEDIYSVDANFLYCRRSVLGHEWEIETPLSRRAAKWGTRLNKLCVRCGTTLEVIIDNNGNIASRIYTYPPGYKIVGDLPVTSQDLRLEALRRLRKGNGNA